MPCGGHWVELWAASGGRVWLAWLYCGCLVVFPLDGLRVTGGRQVVDSFEEFYHRAAEWHAPAVPSARRPEGGSS